MGAGRRTETHTGLNSPTSSFGSGASLSPHFLRLSSKNLGSVIFGCTHSTYKECVEQLIFGLPAAHICYVEKVEPGMPLFLFNYSDRKMHGIFEAASNGELNINPYGWTQGGAGKTTYPAQVRVRVRQHCQPLSEKLFRDAIADNYYSDTHFWFELNHVQTNMLISSFTANPTKTSAKPLAKPQAVLAAPGWKKSATNGIKLQEEEEDADGWIKPKKTSRVTINAWHNAAPFIPLSQRRVAGPSEEITDSLEHLDHSHGDARTHEQITDNFSYSTYVNNSSNNSQCSTGEIGKAGIEKMELPVDNWSPKKSMELDWRSKMFSSNSEVSHSQSDIEFNVEKQEKVERELVILEKLKQIKMSSLEDTAQEVDEVPVNIGSEPDFSDWEKSARERCLQEQTMLREERERLRESLQTLDSSVARTIQKNLELCAAAIAQMRQDRMELKRVLDEVSIKVELSNELETLRKRNAVLEHTQVQMASELQLLKMEVVQISQQLTNCSQGDRLVKEKSIKVDTPVERKIQPRQSCPTVYLLGGHNGESWLGTVDVFCPATNQLKPVAPMLATRSYAAASVLMGQIYVFGGGNGSSWYETAETYDSRKNEWSACAPMSLKRGSLAGATVGGRIFALGGGNGQVIFSDVECYDAHLGIWISSTSMLNKRFCVAAAGLDGALYAIGGYDGRKYLKSVERFDPREALWTAVAPMNKKRGSLSAAFLEGKLYALGGFDGSEFLSSVEFYDPRANGWLEMDTQMHMRRAYGAAAIMDGGLYMVGGLDGSAYIDSVECYRESTGWEVLPSAVVGRRCFLAGAVLESSEYA